ncbi:hypothetical protein M8C21_029822, partial [Ambrosia artemisiifolia]
RLNTPNLTLISRPPTTNLPFQPSPSFYNIHFSGAFQSIHQNGIPFSHLPLSLIRLVQVGNGFTRDVPILIVNQFEKNRQPDLEKVRQASEAIKS